MEKYSFDFIDSEAKELFEELIETSKNYQDYTTKKINELKGLAKHSMESDKELLKKEDPCEWLVLYFDNEVLIHAKSLEKDERFKASTFALLEVKRAYHGDLLNTINLTLKPKFLSSIMGNEYFFHLQKASVISDILEVEEEDIIAFAKDKTCENYSSGSQAVYINLGEFLEEILKSSNS